MGASRFYLNCCDQESEKLYVASCNITEMTIENVALRKYPIYSSFKPVSPIIQY